MDTISIILVIITLIIISFYYYRQYKNYKEQQSKLTWPKEYTRCPDYWIHDGEHKCKNNFKLGKCKDVDMKSIASVSNSSNINTLDNEMNKKDVLEKKCKWAKRCKVSWEGVDKLCA